MIQLVNEYGPKRWTLISKHLKGRTGKQCRERLVLNTQIFSRLCLIYHFFFISFTLLYLLEQLLLSLLFFIQHFFLCSLEVSSSCKILLQAKCISICVSERVQDKYRNQYHMLLNIHIHFHDAVGATRSHSLIGFLTPMCEVADFVSYIHWEVIVTCTRFISQLYVFLFSGKKM